MRQDAPLLGKIILVNANGVGNPSSPRIGIKLVAAIHVIWPITILTVNVRCVTPMKKHEVDTPYKNSWADLMARKAMPPVSSRVSHITHINQDKLMRLQSFNITEATYASNDYYAHPTV